MVKTLTRKQSVIESRKARIRATRLQRQRVELAERLRPNPWPRLVLIAGAVLGVCWLVYLMALAGLGG